MSNQTKQMDLDEVLYIISDIARNGEGADRFRAIKVIKDLVQETGTSGLPDPMSDDETFERMGRLMKALGPTGSQMAYRRAFPHAKRPLNQSAPKVLPTDINIDASTLPNNLKQLYRMFPEIKPRGGFPSGYPLKKGLAVQKKWCQDKARQIILDKEQGRLDEAAIADKEADETPKP